MPKLTKHFSSEEFICHHCGRDGVKLAVPEALEKLRTIVGKPIHINSGYRCTLHPVEAAKAHPGEGPHPKGEAADITVKGMTARELYSKAQEVPEFQGFGVDDQNDYLHVDIRKTPAKWCYSGGHTVPWHENPNPVIPGAVNV